jgi:steroid 5-alpha reductase family enzyme
MVWAAALLGVWALAWWLLSVRLRDVGVVDISWGLMYVLVATVCVVVAEASSPRSLLVAGMATLWGLRLGAYLAWRNLGHPEDRRYVAIRARNDPGFWWKSLFMVFLLQAALAWVISLPIQIAITAADSPLGLLDALACGLWAIGLFFEAVGDGQLARFKARHENEGKVMDRGLWRYTRHPNYFGDFCVWWALYLIAIPASGAWTIVSPLLMTVLLLRVSGVTLLESDIAERRPAYAEYIRRTNAFFPGPRRPLG